MSVSSSVNIFTLKEVTTGNEFPTYTKATC